MIYEVENGALIYYLPEELDHCAADLIKRKSEKAFDGNKIKYLIFDFAKTRFMDSSGIGLITGRFRRVHDVGGRVYALNVTDTIDRVLTMSGIYTILEKRETKDEIKKEMLEGGYYE